jgi:hypothetical protein
LANDPFVELLVDFFGRGDAFGVEIGRIGVGVIRLQNVTAQIDTFIADIHLVRTGDEAIDLFL